MAYWQLAQSANALPFKGMGVDSTLGVQDFTRNNMQFKFAVVTSEFGHTEF